MKQCLPCGLIHTHNAYSCAVCRQPVKKFIPEGAKPVVLELIANLETRALKFADHASVIERMGMHDQSGYMDHSAENDRETARFLKTLL